MTIYHRLFIIEFSFRPNCRTGVAMMMDAWVEVIWKEKGSKFWLESVRWQKSHRVNQ